MNPVAIVGGALGALAGALIWTFIAWAVHLEIGYVAWGVGGLVGLGAVALGGKGNATALACAFLAAAAIFGGKFMSIKVVMADMLHEGKNQHLTREMYQEMMKDAEDFSEVSEEEHARFMATHNYHNEPEARARDITDEELKLFREFQVPILKRLQAEKPDYEGWQKIMIDLVVKLTKEKVSTTSLVWESLGLMDLLFFFLGVGTAYQIVASREAQSRKPLLAEPG